MAKRPMMNVMNAQKHIKDNSTDIQNFLSDLSSWSTEMKAKELAESSSDLTPVENVPLRSDPAKLMDKSNDKSKKTEEKPVKVEKKPAPRDYSEWEKFDAEKACNEVDASKNQKKEHQSEEDLIRRRAIELRLSKMANEKKDQGNQFLKNKDFAKAVECYSEGIRCDKKNAVLYANRAQAHIFQKEFQKAIDDCTESIKIDGLYIKAYFRRAKARFETGQHDKAKIDLEETLRLEPFNLEAKKMLNEINSLAMMKLLAPRSINTSNSDQPTATRPSLFPGIKTVLGSAYNSNIKSALMDDDEDDIGAKGDICEVYPKQIFPIKKPLERRSKRPLLPIHVKMVGDNNEKKMRLDYNGNEGNSTSVSNNSSSLSTPVTDPSSPQLGAGAASPTSLPNLFSQLKMTSIPSKPKTAAQFNSDWKKLKPYPDMCARYLKQMETDDYLIFQDSMEYAILSDILDLLVWEFLPQKWDIVSHLQGLLKVRRFSTLLMFMTEKDRANTRKLVSDCPVEIREDLKSKYLKYDV